jgi:Fe-S cluster biogenesis protein NfuA
MSDEEKKQSDEALEKSVREVLDSVRLQLQSEGGDLELVSIDEQKRVHVRMFGVCGTCPMASMELKTGIEQYLKEQCPEVTEIVQEM